MFNTDINSYNFVSQEELIKTKLILKWMAILHAKKELYSLGERTTEEYKTELIDIINKIIEL